MLNKLKVVCGIVGASLCSLTNLYAQWCDGIGEKSSSSIPTSGPVKAIVIAVSWNDPLNPDAYDDQQKWDDYYASLPLGHPDIGKTWPDMPNWLTDSFIAPDIVSITDDPYYERSISRYYYEESWGDHQLYGEVNPGNEEKYAKLCLTFQENEVYKM